MHFVHLHINTVAFHNRFHSPGRRRRQVAGEPPSRWSCNSLPSLPIAAAPPRAVVPRGPVPPQRAAPAAASPRLPCAPAACAATARAPTSRPRACSTAARAPALRPRPRGLTRSGATAPVGCRSSASSLSRASRLRAIVRLSGCFFCSSVPGCLQWHQLERFCLPHGG